MQVKEIKGNNKNKNITIKHLHMNHMLAQNYP